MWGAIAAIGGSVVGGLLGSQAQKSAASKAASAQIEAAKLGIGFQEKQLAEQQYQFDQQMEEYRRKQLLLEQNYAQMTQQLQPYIQAGQGALYEQMALAGVAAPGSMLSIQPTTKQPLTIGGGAAVGIPTGERSQIFRPAVQPGGAVLKPATATTGSGGMRTIFEAVNQALKTPVTEVKKTISQANAPAALTHNVVNPYVGMTGEQAQAAAIQRISQSPLLAELMTQGEQGILQNAAATGGLRGGNVQGALAQFRPQMLQDEINRQYVRLGGLAEQGQQSILQTPTVSAGGMPSYPGMDTSIANLLGQIGQSQAAQALAQGQTQSNLWSGLGSAGGLALGYYLNQPQQQPTISYV